jgi:hypothetical protein
MDGIKDFPKTSFEILKPNAGFMVSELQQYRINSRQEQ